MRAEKFDYDYMSDQLRSEIRESVRNGELLFMPSPEVRSEAVRSIRPRSTGLTYVKIDDGSGTGQPGDGKMLGIGMAKVMVDHILALETEVSV